MSDLLTHLTTLTDSLTTSLTSLPDPSDSSAILPPKNGISLLDVKNDVLLSYLHNLVFLTLLRLKSGRISGSPVIEDLIKLRLLLERGTKPLEQKLKYQIDKVVQAAVAQQKAEEDAEEAANRPAKDDGDASSGEDSDDDDDVSGSESEVEEGDAARKAALKAAMAPAPEDLAYRPNPAALLAAAAGEKKGGKEDAGDGIYRPPRIAATAMPEITSAKEKKERAAPRAHAIEDFIGDEISAAPVAVPSIGTTITQGGRGHKTSREKKIEDERRQFEEENFVRLPKMNKKEAQAMRKQTRGARENQFGGEDWRSFAGDLEKLTKSAGKSRGEKVLERSRKRGGDEDGEGGRQIGEHYAGRKGMHSKRRKM
jgi:U3 small nucleolar ribonucleoprotein protein LCP5